MFDCLFLMIHVCYSVLLHCHLLHEFCFEAPAKRQIKDKTDHENLVYCSKYRVYAKYIIYFYIHVSTKHAFTLKKKEHRENKTEHTDFHLCYLCQALSELNYTFSTTVFFILSIKLIPSSGVTLDTRGNFRQKSKFMFRSISQPIL